MSEDAQGLQVGSQFGPYRLKRLIGRGGMGVVYEAEDTVQDRVVALKLLLETLSSDADFRARLQREARIAGRLQEPHVVPIHHCGEIEGQWYVDMRLIDGTDLHAMLSRYGPLAPERAVAIVAQVASALDAAHAAGVIHRDVKPENILITGDDFAYLVDFGLANAADDLRLTQLGTAVGTWAYMAPERFGEAEVTYRADIYSLACVLYEALTGSRPYTAGSVSAMINSHLSREVPKPSVARAGIPAGFDEVIARGMAKDPDDRYATAGDLAMAAQHVLSTTSDDGAARTAGASQAATLPVAGTQQPPSMPSGAPGFEPSAPTMAASAYQAPTVSGALPPQPVQQPAQQSAGPQQTASPGQSWPQQPTTQSVPQQPAPQPAPPSWPQQPAPPPGPPSWPQQPAAQSWPQQPAAQSWPQQPAAQSWPQQPPTQSGAQPFGVPPTGPQPIPGVGQPTWPPQPPARKRNPWLLLGVAALVLVAVLGGLGIWLGTRGNNNHPGATTTSTTATTTITTTTAAADPQSQLQTVLPKGYAPDACKSADPTYGALAAVICDVNTEPNGPGGGDYWLYKDVDALQSGFTQFSNNQQLVNCPDHTDSTPYKWHYKKTPNVDAGSVACGHFKTSYVVMWTVNSKLLLGAALGKDLNNLYDWWTNYG